MEFTLQETLQDAIVAHKFLMNAYSQFEIECSNKELRKLLENLRNVASEHNLKLFKIMKEQGFYQTTPAPEKEIKQAVKMHKEMQQELEKKVCKKC